MAKTKEKLPAKSGRSLTGAERIVEGEYQQGNRKAPAKSSGKKGRTINGSVEKETKKLSAPKSKPQAKTSRMAKFLGRIGRAAKPVAAVAALTSFGKHAGEHQKKLSAKQAEVNAARTRAATGGKKPAASKPKAAPKKKEAAKPVKSVKTKGGNYPVYKKSSGEAKSFREAFAAARKGGQSVFTWQGRKYNTKVK